MKITGKGLALDQCSVNNSYDEEVTTRKREEGAGGGGPTTQLLMGPAQSDTVGAQYLPTVVRHTVGAQYLPITVRHTAGAQYPPTVVPSLGFAHHPAFVSQMKTEGDQLVPFLQVIDSYTAEQDRTASPMAPVPWRCPRGSASAPRTALHPLSPEAPRPGPRTLTSSPGARRHSQSSHLSPTTCSERLASALQSA